MNDNPVLDDAATILRDLIARFGAFRVFAYYVRAAMPRRAPPADELPDYLRADVGLPPRPPDPRLWERYR